MSGMMEYEDLEEEFRKCIVQIQQQQISLRELEQRCFDSLMDILKKKKIMDSSESSSGGSQNE